MGLTALFTDPFFTGAAQAPYDEVPGRFPAALAGHGYFLDLRKYKRQTIETIREQADTSDEPGEHSLNPAGYWRRSMESFHHGAGQVFFDAKESVRTRFRSSKGINPWVRGELSLLNDPAERLDTAATNLKMVAVEGRVYVLDGNNVKFATDPTSGSWTTVTGTPGATPTSLTTDGDSIFIQYPAAIYKTTRTTSVAAAYGTTGAGVLVGYANGRLLQTTAAGILNEISGAGSTTTALWTHPNASFVWTCISEGQNAIYVGGYAGSNGEVYRIALEEGGVALGAPIPAIALPDGEQVWALRSYVGGVVLGTSRGIRFAAADGSGNLQYGPVIRTTSPVKALEGEDQYVWFGWTNYDGVSSGLGRLDLASFTAELTPAWASDLMATAQGDITGIITFGGLRYFAVNGAGYYGETTAKVPTATIDFGTVRWSTTDRKTVHTVDVRTRPLNGAMIAWMSTDGDAFEELGVHDVLGSTRPVEPIDARQATGEEAELRFTFTRSSITNSLGPVLTRWTLKALVIPERSERIEVPLLVKSRVTSNYGEGQEVFFDTLAEWEFIKALERTGEVVLYQEGTRSYRVVIDQVSLEPESYVEGHEFFNGTILVALRTVEAG